MTAHPFTGVTHPEGHAGGEGDGTQVPVTLYVRPRSTPGRGRSRGGAASFASPVYHCPEHGRVKAYLNRYPVKGGHRLTPVCSICHRLNTKLWIGVHRAHVRARRRERTVRETGNEVFLAKRRGYYARNREAILAAIKRRARRAA